MLFVDKIKYLICKIKYMIKHKCFFPFKISVNSAPTFNFPPTNPYAYIQSDEDVFVFLKITYDIAMNDADDDSNISQEAMQLLWILTAYLLHTCNIEDRTIESLIKLLNGPCAPASQREEKTTFDIMIEDWSEDHPELSKKYEYFKYNVFGVYSNCYKRIVSECLEVLNGVPFEKVAEEQKKIKSTQNVLSDKDKASFFGFDKLIPIKGQNLQLRLYNKRQTAVHEAGHAVACYILKEPLDGATIIDSSKTGSMGHIQVPKDYICEASAKAIRLFAGSIAEEIIYQFPFIPAWESESDFRRATSIIKNEIIANFSEPGQAQKYIFIDQEVLGLADKESPYIVYETIKRCVELRQAAFDLIVANKGLVEALAQELLDKKSMTGEEVISFLDNISTSLSENDTSQEAVSFENKINTEELKERSK